MRYFCKFISTNNFAIIQFILRAMTFKRKRSLFTFLNSLQTAISHLKHYILILSSSIHLFFYFQNFSAVSIFNFSITLTKKFSNKIQRVHLVSYLQKFSAVSVFISLIISIKFSDKIQRSSKHMIFLMKNK